MATSLTNKNYLIPCFLLLTLSSFAQDKAVLLTDNPLKSSIDSAVQNGAAAYMGNAGTIGLSIGVYDNGRSYTYNYGEIKKGTGQLPKAGNIYNLGSVAKTFVGIMLAEAVIEGKANLTDDIRKFLPGSYQNLQFDGHPVTLVDLANHTSGLPGSAGNGVMDSLKKLSLTAQLHLLTKYNQDSLLKDMHHFKVDTIPGTKYRYNGNAMMVLILVLEHIYHQPYEQLVTGYLKTKLGMFDTSTQITVEQLPRFAQGYGADGQPRVWYDQADAQKPYINTMLFYGGPSMNSTMADMLKYIKANLDEQDPAIRLSHQQTWGDSKGFGLGLNWMFDKDDNGDRYYFHAGHTGIGFNTLCTFYPGHKAGIIIIVNDNISQDKLSELEDVISKRLMK